MQRGAAVQRNTFVDLNILPPALRPHRYPQWYVLGLVVVVVGCLLLAPLVLVERSATSETGHLRDQLALINERLSAVEMDIGEQRALHLQIDEATAALQALQAERYALLGSQQPVSDGLTRAFDAAPADLSITSVARSEGTITISGESSSADDVVAYAMALTQAGGFSNVTITSLIEPEGGSGSGTFEVQAAW